MKKIHILLYIIVINSQQLLAQDSLHFGTDYYVSGYMKAVSEYASLYSGNCQQSLEFRVIDHQYFKEQHYVIGKLFYNGILYPDVLLRWDLYRDELIVLSPAGSNIVLINENTGFAEIHGYHIFYHHPDGSTGCPSAGYYLLLHSGKYRLLEKISYSPNVAKIEGKRLTYTFLVSSFFYLQKDEVYHKINSQRKLLKTLGTHRKEMKSLIQSNGYKYKRNAEEMALELVKEHEKLSRYE